MDENPFDNPQFRWQYKQAVKSGEFVEGVYNCESCGFGGTFLTHVSAIKDLTCLQCGADGSSVARSVLRF
jgi:uncharacterized protein CbrC (UPF0167 family)